MISKDSTEDKEHCHIACDNVESALDCASNVQKIIVQTTGKIETAYTALLLVVNTRVLQQCVRELNNCATLSKQPSSILEAYIQAFQTGISTTSKRTFTLHGHLTTSDGCAAAWQQLERLLTY